MSEINTPAPEATNVPETIDRIKGACDIAANRVPADPAAAGWNIIGAKKDLNSKGRGPQWYRMVYRNGWEYVSSERLPNGSFLASDRRAEVRGTVFPGEIVVSHDRGGPVDVVWVIALAKNEENKVMEPCSFNKRRDGNLSITLPDGSVVILPDPRKK